MYRVTIFIGLFLFLFVFLFVFVFWLFFLRLFPITCLCVSHNYWSMCVKSRLFGSIHDLSNVKVAETFCCVRFHR